MKLTITKQEFKKFYIHNYYYDQKTVMKLMRRYMGPILLAVGVYLHVSANGIIGAIYIWFCIIYGIFYSARPFLLMQVKKIQDETFTFEFRDNELLFKDRLVDTSINLARFRIHENKKYFTIKLDNGQVLFFPKDMLNKQTFEEFKSRV